MEDAILTEIKFELVGCVFTSIITLKLFNGSVKLLFHKSFEFKEALINITFIKHGIQPSKSAVIINEDDIELAASERWNGRSPNI